MSRSASGNNHRNHQHHSNSVTTTGTTAGQTLVDAGGQQQSRRKSFSWTSHLRYEHMLAGISGGVASTLVLHPLDLLKIRLAVNDGQVSTRPQYNGLVNAVRTILKDEGFRGLYRGVTPNYLGAGASWGFYFLFYNNIKQYMLDSTGRRQLGPERHMLAAAGAGLITLTLTNPLWVVKTRLCLQYGQPQVSLPLHRQYYGMIDAFRKVYKYEGIRGLYKGFVPGIFGVSHGALQFMAYEELKDRYIEHYNLPPECKLSTGEYLSFAAMSKLFAATITYPYQVLRARLQDQHNNYNGMIDVIKKTWRLESIFGFYKGLGAYLLHVMPNICIVLLVYEKLPQLLSHPERFTPKKLD